MFVSDCMSKDPITVQANLKLVKGIDIMAEKNVGSLIVKRNNTTVGVVTERDIIRELVKVGKIPAYMAAEKMLTTAFVCISPDISIEDAAKEMFSKKGRLLVFKDNDLVGVLTVTDFIRVFSKKKKNPSLEKVASMHILTAASDETVASVLKIMNEHEVGSVLITEKGTPTGIFTERDLLTRVLYKGDKLTSKVNNFASKPLITLPLDSGAREAASLMVKKKIKRLPLVSNGKIVGIVTARDVVEAFVKA